MRACKLMVGMHVRLVISLAFANFYFLRQRSFVWLSHYEKIAYMRSHYSRTTLICQLRVSRAHNVERPRPSVRTFPATKAVHAVHNDEYFASSRDVE